MLHHRKNNKPHHTAGRTIKTSATLINKKQHHTTGRTLNNATPLKNFKHNDPPIEIAIIKFPPLKKFGNVSEPWRVMYIVLTPEEKKHYSQTTEEQQTRSKQ